MENYILRVEIVACVFMPTIAD